jgi:hypothetical protein
MMKHFSRHGHPQFVITCCDKQSLFSLRETSFLAFMALGYDSEVCA